ncbi:GGDEF domain-containing protein [Sphingomonas sp. SRS2]|uniref:GGDEF domain-containing protein n=1 Tax=Sphingomonas sp. SRS2 TaxID=133190 RepID=UPI0006184C60|nr:GGDEF domain-containing protein [Sphingomonas sp. SRS2]KKC26163.1 diguanylate cyclase [Sphingomonas sp. SRS2]
MTAALVNVFALSFIAAMLAAVMLIAWRSFGKPRYAMIWAIAFGVATVEWVGNLFVRFHASDNLLLCSLVVGLCCLSNALIAIGFVQRIRPGATMTPLLLAAVAAAIAITTIVFLFPQRDMRDAIWLFFGGTMLAISAGTIVRSLRTASLPERATMAMLILFMLVDFGLGALALGQGISGEGERYQLFRLVLVLLYPLAFIGVGIFSVFLVAADLAENMRMLATSDELTGIYNRRGFEESAERAIRNAQRQRQPLAVVVGDIDNFKAVNDKHGHSVGDRALKHFATRLERMVRRGDLIGRIGGEEFALLLVNTRAQDALEVVERIRRDIGTMPVEGRNKIVMTASFGVTGLRPGDISLAALLLRADRALYRSKLEGRDRVTSAEDLEDRI